MPSLFYILFNNYDNIEKAFRIKQGIINVSYFYTFIIERNVMFDYSYYGNELIYIEKIINHQLNTNKHFIIFDDLFWSSYLESKPKIFRGLVFIYKIFLLYTKINNNLSQTKNLMLFQIDNCKNVGELKNEKLIEFVEKEYPILKSFNLSNVIISGINLETINEKFIEKWNKSNYCKYQFKKEIINKINNKTFHLLFKLFDYKDSKIFDKDIFLLLCERFHYFIYSHQNHQNIFNNLVLNNSLDLITNISLLIYIYDQKYKDIRFFMENIIVKNIYSIEVLCDIFLDFISGYKDISQDAKDWINDFFIRNKNYLNDKELLFLLQKENSNYINEFIIKEQDLFKKETNNESFKFLKMILKKQINIKYPEIYETNYFKSIIGLSAKILNTIKTGNLKFSLVRETWGKNETKNVIIDKLETLFFNDNKKVAICKKELDERYNKIINIFEYINKLAKILEQFYETKYQNNINLIISLGNEIEDGMLNEIEKIEMKNKIEEIYKIIPNLDKIFLIKDSKFFNIFIDIQKVKFPSENEDKRINCAEESFKKLKSLFIKNWINIIDEAVIKECFKAINFMGDQEILNELHLLRLYFELKEIDNNYLFKLLNEIKILKHERQTFSEKEYIKLKNELLNLKNELNNNNQSYILNLQNNINIKEQELKSLKYKLNYLNEELNQFKKNIVNPSDNEISFAINFISCNQDILYPITCKTSDTIVKLEEQLYNEYPKYKDYNTYLTVNGNIVKRFKTIEENEIKKGNAIMVNIYEE